MKSLERFFKKLAARPESTYEIARVAKISQRLAWAYKAGEIKRPSYEVVTRLEEWMAKVPPAKRAAKG